MQPERGMERMQFLCDHTIKMNKIRAFKKQVAYLLKPLE